MSTLPNPESRNEQYLQFLANGSGTLPEKPESRIEEYLAYLCEHGGGGGSTPMLYRHVVTSEDNEDPMSYQFGFEVINTSSEHQFSTFSKIVTYLSQGSRRFPCFGWRSGGCTIFLLTASSGKLYATYFNSSTVAQLTITSTGDFTIYESIDQI